MGTTSTVTFASGSNIINPREYIGATDYSVSMIGKKLLDPSLLALMQAGYMNPDLTLTSTGKCALEAIVFNVNKDALVAAAQEVIDARKKS